MSLLNRIKTLAHKQGLTLRDIEIQLNLGTRSMQRWDKNSPSANKVLDVANLLHTSVDYLLTGNILNQKYSETYVDNGISSRYEYTKENSNVNKINEPKFSYTYEKYVPVLGKVAAGIPITLVEEYMDQTAAPSSDVDFATIANGESMEPVIHDGEHIFIKSMQSLDNGDIGVFDIDGETTCKRFKYYLNTKNVILSSFNSAFKPLKYPLKNYQDTFRIIGKVILTNDQEDRYHSFIRK